MASYEKIRQKRIEENKLKMEEYGLKKAVNAMSQLNKTSKKKISKMHSKPNSKNDNDEYTPTGNAELNSSEDENEPMMNTVQLRSRSKKAESKKKQESSTNQIYRHTMGPKSFARKQYELQQQDAEKRPPSQACMYKETRKRKAGNEYKTPYEAIQSNIDKMDEVQLERKVDGDIAYCEVMESDMSKDKIQLRKCSIIKGQSKRVSVGGIIIPDEYLQPIKEQIMKDTVGEVIKMFKQQLHPETFANLSQTLGGLSCIPELETDQERDNAKNPSGEHVQDQDDEVE